MSEPEEEDFAALFEQSEQARRIEKGRTIEGKVVAIGEESALVDVGGKSEAEIDVSELKDEDGRPLVSRTAVAVVGSGWLLGSVLMGWSTASPPDLGTRIEWSLGWAAFGLVPAIVMILVWSYLD